MTARVCAKDGSVAEGFWAWIWPNTAINVYACGLSLERVVPLSAERTRIEYTYAFAESVTPEEQKRAIDQSTELTFEDRRIVEAVYANRKGGAYESGPLSPVRESALVVFQDRNSALLR